MDEIEDVSLQIHKLMGEINSAQAGDEHIRLLGLWVELLDCVIDKLAELKCILGNNPVSRSLMKTKKSTEKWVNDGCNMFMQHRAYAQHMLPSVTH